MKLLTILFTLLLSASALAQEDRITVSGFWAGMSASEFASNCIARGYYCADESFQIFNKPPNGFDDEVEDTQMVMYGKKNSLINVIIPCGITNTCSMSLFEVADLLVSENIVSVCDESGENPRCYNYEFENGMLDVMYPPEMRNYPSIYINFFLTPNFN